jgi:hypothetical protein
MEVNMVASEARPVLLVGSLALSSAEDVFSEVGARLGNLVMSVPDGETGERLKWVGFFSDQLADVDGLELAQEIPFGGQVPQILRFYRPTEGQQLAKIEMGSPGYAEVAEASYKTFLAARDSGAIGQNVRFQVSLPTPLVLSGFIQVPFEERLAFVERIMSRELEAILAAIPHDDLAVQWDLALETESEEARRHSDRAPPFLQPDWSFDAMIEAAARCMDAVPDAVMLGVHLCYGNPDGGHLIEPADGSVMRDIATALTRTTRRTIDWIHMPVPIGRDDDAFFAPFRSLEISPDTQLYLGLVHEDDGLGGAKRRLAAAERYLPRTGVATECGMGRRNPERIPHLLDLHRCLAHET